MFIGPIIGLSVFFKVALRSNIYCSGASAMHFEVEAPSPWISLSRDQGPSPVTLLEQYKPIYIHITKNMLSQCRV